MSKFSQFIKNLGSKFGRQKGIFSVSTNRLPDPDVDWNQTTLLNAYKISLITNKAISKRAEKVGEIDFVLKNESTGEIVTDDDRLDIFKNPNPLFTGRQFWALYQKYRDITGQAFIWIVPKERELFEDRKIDSLVLLRPDRVKVAVDKEGRIVGYEFQSPNGTTIRFSEKEIIYLWNPDPENSLMGESIMRSGIRAIDTENQITSYQSKVIRNGGKVEGVINFKTTGLTPTQLTEIRDSYREQYAGAAKSGMPLFLGGEADYKKVALSPDELAFLDSKKLNINDILMMTGVPRTLLGSFDEVKFSNAEASLRIFLRETIKPLLKELTDKLDAKFFPEDNLTLSFDDPTPEDQETKRANLETANKINAMTTNEKREEINLEPIKGGDDILVPFNLVPLGESGDTEKSLKRRQKLIKKYPHPLRDKDVREMYGNIMIKRMDRNEEVFIKALKKYFRGQQKRVIESLSSSVGAGMTKNAIDEAFNAEIEVNIAREELTPILERIVEESGVNAMVFAGSDFEFNLSSDIGSWLNQKVDIFTKQINITTFEKLQSEFADSLAGGENRSQLVRRIEDTYDNQIEKWKATQIARTEVLGATQKGTFEGYKQAMIPIKIWVTVGDANVRDSHASQDGEERPINDAFTNGQQFPGDPAGGASETVNCRCSI